MFLHFLQSKEQKIAFLDLANLVAEGDGFVNPKERSLIRELMAEINIEPTEYNYDGKRSMEEIIGCLEDVRLKQLFFTEIMLLIYADGDYNDEEKQLAVKLQQLFGISDQVYNAVKDWVIRLDRMKIEGIKLILS
ncbi:TerB family tellurite resistance protein [Paenibacillus sp. NPDC058071]|uniref:TerB family tellurite resistance protein n=1 Tax=Paenibacillus sp. NPDC058071 TaxID=3346326 RepID=UPI0036DBBB35